MHINDDGDEPVLMPIDWRYNDEHVSLINNLLPGYSPELVATCFAYDLDGFHSANWDYEFTRWVQRVATDEKAMRRFKASLDMLAHIPPPAGCEAV